MLQYAQRARGGFRGDKGTNKSVNLYHPITRMINRIAPGSCHPPMDDMASLMSSTESFRSGMREARGGDDDVDDEDGEAGSMETVPCGLT